jgi:hypothetical protein
LDSVIVSFRAFGRQIASLIADECGDRLWPVSHARKQKLVNASLKGRGIKDPLKVNPSLPRDPLGDVERL